jgi:micrococcal nuclease
MIRRFACSLFPSLLLAACLALVSAVPGSAQSQRKPQPRAHGTQVDVPLASLAVDDGDTFTIVWAAGDTEIVRILGIDTPETKHVQHGLPQDQTSGPEARAYAQGAVAFAEHVQLLRSDTMDPYGRTLGYFFIDGKNYSVGVVAAHLAYETVSHYGDNGFPEQAKAVAAAAQVAGTPSFEPPWEVRKKAREATRGAGTK